MIQTHRGVVVSRNGVVAASQPLAVSAGLGVLQGGGRFMDAALAMSAVLAVVEPYNSHLGGDAFVIVYDAKTRRTTAFNASGAAPAAATPGRFARGIPVRGLAAASVPGLVDCWFALHERYATMPLDRVLAPAIGYAESGFPAGFRYASVFRAHLDDSRLDWPRPMARALIGKDRAPGPGETIVQSDLAWTLKEISVGGRDAFYQGPVTTRMLTYSDAHGGLFSTEDFASHRTQVSEPIRTDYRGFTVHGQPPVSQGFILLEELNVVEGFDVRSMGFGTAESIHTMVEAKKLAFADRAAYLGDPRVVKVPMASLVSKEFAVERGKHIDPARAGSRVTAGDIDRETTYFCVADADGNAVSFIQSIFHGFGCGVVAEGTGVLFNNRMTGFSLDPDSPNVLAPGKRTAHTLNAYLITRGDRLAWVGGTPGGDVQVQSNLQVICNVVDFGLGPQEAVEAPRWQHSQPEGGPSSGVLEVEDRVDEATVGELKRRGHEVRLIGPWAHGSSYQLIAVDERTGAYMAGSDPRCDGHAAGY